MRVAGGLHADSNRRSLLVVAYNDDQKLNKDYVDYEQAAGQGKNRIHGKPIESENSFKVHWPNKLVPHEVQPELSTSITRNPHLVNCEPVGKITIRLHGRHSGPA